MKFFAVFLYLFVCFVILAEAQQTTKPPTNKPSTSKTTTSTTTKQPTTTKKPTTKQPTTTKRPSTTTKQPTTTKRPSTTTKQPTTTKKPTTLRTTTKASITSTTKSTPSTAKPSTTTTTRKASTVTSIKPTATTTKTTPITATSTQKQTTVTATTGTLKPTTWSSLKTTSSSPSEGITTPTSLTENVYCNISTCSVPCENTLCKFTNTSWGTACQPPYPSQSIVSLSDISLILNTHNSYRSRVAKGHETRGNPGPQPSASNMRKLVWDDELAAMSTAHAHQCVSERDICRDVGRFRVGQTIYNVQSSIDNLGTSNWTEAIGYWYDEVQYMTSSYVSSFPLNPTNSMGQYTQLVWAETYTLGCGVAYYQSNFTVGYPYNRFYVCNYGPAANWIGSPVYSQGTAGSACPSGTTPNSDGLCA